MNILDNAKKHFQAISGTLRKIEVPEWGDENGAAIMYAKPLNMTQKAEIITLVNAGKVGESLFMKIYHMARDENGARLFKRSDMDAFLKEIDPDIVSSVALKLDYAPSDEDISKN